MNFVCSFKSLLSVLLFTLTLNTFADNSKPSGKTYYRYTNDQGVKVLDLSIPPRYAQQGYEILNSAGQVIRVVPPAPSEKDIAKVAAEREMRARFHELQKRYKSVEEIEAAKARRLSSIKTNISILNSNISGLNAQLKSFTGNAASFEREGRPVPKSILQKLADTKAELSVAKDLLEIREKEYKNVGDQFNQDLIAFVKGSTLLEAQN